MYNSITDVYATKRETINFSKSLVIKEKQVEAKFVTQLIYGILRSGSIILKNIGTALNEPIQIGNTIDQLSKKPSTRFISRDSKELYPKDGALFR